MSSAEGNRNYVIQVNRLSRRGLLAELTNATVSNPDGFKWNRSDKNSRKSSTTGLDVLTDPFTVLSIPLPRSCTHRFTVLVVVALAPLPCLMAVCFSVGSHPQPDFIAMLAAISRTIYKQTVTMFEIVIMQIVAPRTWLNGVFCVPLLHICACMVPVCFAPRLRSQAALLALLRMAV